MAIPGMFSGLATGGAPQGAPQGMPQLNDDQKRKLLEMFMQRQQQQGGQPRPGAGPGMFSGLMRPGMPGQPPAGAAPKQQGPQQQNVPGAATPEQASADRAQMLRKAGAAVGQPQTQQTGMFTPIGSRSAAGNIFSGDPRWHSGIFDTTERTSPFDSFYVNREASNAWL